MSSRLTLLFLCYQCEPSPILISALEQAGFQLLISYSQKEAGQLIQTFMIDTVVVCPKEPALGRMACTSLKRQVPRTPILLLTKDSLRPESYPGIYSVLHADPYDEVLACAVALFLRESIRAVHLARVSSLAAPTPSDPRTGPTPCASA